MFMRRKIHVWLALLLAHSKPTWSLSSPAAGEQASVVNGTSAASSRTYGGAGSVRVHAESDDACGSCRQWVSGSAYNGNDLLPKGAPCPDWWSLLEVGECKPAPSQPALILDGKEACCTFCIEHNRRSLQPPCTHASFGPTSSGIDNLCYVKTGTPSNLEKNRLPRDSFLAGEPCPTYQPPRRLSWGGAFVLALGTSLAAYLVGGTRLGSRRHPHYQFWKELWGLTVDGWWFMRGGNGRRTPDAAEAHSLQSSLLPHTSATVPSDQSKQACSGPTTALHRATATGNAAAVEQLLQGDCSTVDVGDKRRFTAFHIACAGGHAQIVKLLLAAGCDCTLENDNGYSGWELAESLHRAEVLGLRASPTTANKQSGRRKATREQRRQGRETDATHRPHVAARPASKKATTVETGSGPSMVSDSVLL